MLEPNADRTEFTSPARSLTTPLLDFDVLVGLHSEGEGVIIGCPAVAAGRGAGEHAIRGSTVRRRAATVLSILKEEWLARSRRDEEEIIACQGKGSASQKRECFALLVVGIGTK